MDLLLEKWVLKVSLLISMFSIFSPIYSIKILKFISSVTAKLKLFKWLYISWGKTYAILALVFQASLLTPWVEGPQCSHTRSSWSGYWMQGLRWVCYHKPLIQLSSNSDFAQRCSWSSARLSKPSSFSPANPKAHYRPPKSLPWLF